jgi:hypothetical protein
MITLRCTHKPLRRGLTESPQGELAATTPLGDWYANVLVTRPQHLLLCISERTLLPVVVPAKGICGLPARLAEALPPILAALSIPPASVQAECAHMREHRIGRTANRRVLGSLNELMFPPNIACTTTPNDRCSITRCGSHRPPAKASGTTRRIAPRRRCSYPRRPLRRRATQRANDLRATLARARFRLESSKLVHTQFAYSQVEPDRGPRAESHLCRCVLRDLRFEHATSIVSSERRARCRARRHRRAASVRPPVHGDAGHRAGSLDDLPADG